MTISPEPVTPAQAPSPAAPPAPAAPGAPAAQTHRPTLDPATRRQTVIVAAVIAVLFWGSQILNEALPASAQGQVAPGDAAEIGDGAWVTPLADWVVSPHDKGAGIRLEKGVVVVDLFPETFGGSAGALAQGYLDQVLEPGATQLTMTDIEVATTAMGTAARFSYQGIFEGVDVPIEGEVTALFIGRQGVVADAWSRQGDLAGLLGEVHGMLETIEVRA